MPLITTLVPIISYVFCKLDTGETCSGTNGLYTKFPSLFNLVPRTCLPIRKPKIEITPVGSRSVLGEGPFWDEDAQRLYWVDMKSNTLNSYHPATDSHVKAKIVTDRSPLCLVVRVKGTKDRFVVGLKGDLAVVRWDGVSEEPLTPSYFAEVEGVHSGTRINDGKADPANRLWFGTMGSQLSSNPNTFEKDMGSLYRLGPDGKVHKLLDGLQLSNGLAWSPEADKMYFVDSLAYDVYQFDYDNSNGAISNQKVIFDLAKHKMVDAMNSLPDGMTIDRQGMLWVAVYGTQKVIRINPHTGEKLFEIMIPKALQPTSVAFGGKDLDILFVTSARVDWTEQLEQEYGLSGSLFKVTGLGVSGWPSRDVQLDEKFWKDV